MNLIVAVPHDGIVDKAAPVCLPSASRERPGPNQTLVIEWFEDRVAANSGVPPYEWPTVCGQLGIVYVRGGLFEKAQACIGCAAIDTRVRRAA